MLLFDSFLGKRFLEYALICACLTRYGRSGRRYTLSQGRTKPKSFGCSVSAHARRRFLMGELSRIGSLMALHEEEAYEAWNLAVQGKAFEKIVSGM